MQMKERRNEEISLFFSFVLLNKKLVDLLIKEDS